MSNIPISDFSPHLFWDTDRGELDMDKHKKYIIGRALDYGLMNDWKIIRDYYGINEIADTATKLRYLSYKSIHFISLLSGRPLTEFRCYTLKQSNPQHLDF
jgi:hypothetical protein